MASEVASGSRRAGERLLLAIGEGMELEVQRNWAFKATQRAGVGFDKARVRIPTAGLVESRWNLLGVFRVKTASTQRVIWEGIVEEAWASSRGDVVIIHALGWGHLFARAKGTVQARGVPSPEIMYNLGTAIGMDPSGIAGYSPTTHAYKVTSGVVGLPVATSQRAGPFALEPLLGSDEGAVARWMQLDSRSKRDPWGKGHVLSAILSADTFWEAIAEGSVELFQAVALIQYQWLSGATEKFSGSNPSRYLTRWAAPRVSISNVTLARQLDEAKSMAMSRPRLVFRPRKLKESEMLAAVERMGQQFEALNQWSPRRRMNLLNGVHLFVRATESSDWRDALLFYAGAADQIANLAPRRRVFSARDREALLSASEGLFGPDDPRHQRVTQLLAWVNNLPFKERLQMVADEAGVELKPIETEATQRLYGMRNYLVHAGRYPDPDIHHLFLRGLAVLDRILSRLLEG